MRRIFFLLFILFSGFIVSGQQLSGRVLDASTKRPIAFANLLYDSQHGVTSDIDGYFSIDARSTIDSIRVSYVGYHTKKVSTDDHDTLKIFLEPKTYQLDEVVVTAGPNPALRIIKNVVENKETNNPDNYSSYSFRAYDKIIVTIHPDSLQKYKRKKENDTSFQKLLDFVEKQHFFISESVTRTRYEKPRKKHEEVMLSRSSGFTDPIFVVLISRLQSNSFYDDEINILDKNYVSPIASRSISRYNYRIQDTLFIEDSPDTTFVVSYSPGKKASFDALKGMLYVNTNGWALQNVLARPAQADESGLNIKIEQKYEKIGGTYWFPVQLSTEIFFGNVQANGIPLMGKGKRYVTKVTVNKQKDIKVPGDIAVEIMPEAFNKGLDSLSRYRRQPISSKEKETYRVIDSIGEANNFDQEARSLMTLTEEKIPFHFLNIPLEDLLNYNKYEGFYLGLGLETNDKFSQTLKLGGYGGYGFKDKEFKYGASARVFLDKLNQNYLSYRYINDLKEPASYFSDKRENILDPSSYREFVVGRFDKVESQNASLKVHPVKYTDVEFSLTKADYQPTYDYSFSGFPDNDKFRFTEAGVNIRFAFNEKHIKSPQGLISMGTNFPVLNLRYIRGLDGFLDGQFSYSKWLMSLNHSFQSTLVGVTSYNLYAGYINKSIPYAGLFEGRGSYGKFALFAPQSFSTMRPAEFLSDRFVSLYLSHDFKELLVDTQFFSPSISIHHNMMIGDLRNENLHQKIDFHVPRKGYIESGVVFSNILKTNFSGIGMGFFYRYGAYQFNDFSNNFTVNLSLTFLFD